MRYHAVMQSRTVAHSLRTDNRRRQAASLRRPERRPGRERRSSGSLPEAFSASRIPAKRAGDGPPRAFPR